MAEALVERAEVVPVLWVVVAAAVPVVRTLPVVAACKGAVVWPAICERISAVKTPVISLRLSKKEACAVSNVLVVRG